MDDRKLEKILFDNCHFPTSAFTTGCIFKSAVHNSPTSAEKKVNSTRHRFCFSCVETKRRKAELGSAMVL